MTKALSIGLQNYKPLKDYIVDKTLIIQEFLDMTIDSIELFKDTQIMKAKYIYQINQYPTMFISFANGKGNQLSIIQTIKKVAREAINQFEINSTVLI